MIVRDGKVERLLAAGEAPPGSPTHVSMARVRTLLPGLIDAHGHVPDLGQARLQPDLRGTASVAEAVDRVRKFAGEHADARWIIGHGWNQVLWPDRRFPTARDLDAVSPIVRCCCHASTATRSGSTAPR